MKTPIIALLALCGSLGYAQSRLSANDALQLAVQNRPSVRALKLDVERARAQARASGAYLPTIFGAGGSSIAEAGATDGDLFLSQGIDLFGRVSAGRRVGAASVKLAEANYRSELISLQSEVLEAYVQAVAASDLADSADLLLKVAEGLLSATKRRFEEGKVAEVQLIRANIEFERSRQAASLRAAGKSAALKRLAAVLGIESVAAVDEQLFPTLAEPAASDRPDLAALRAQSEIAQAESDLARANGKPEFEVQLRRSPWNESRAYYGARIQMIWAVFDHGKSRAESDVAKKRGAAAKAQLEDAQRRAASELKAVQIEIYAAKAQVDSYEKILTSARDLVEKSQRGYSEGFGTQVDVLEATRALREVEQELVEARERLSLSIIQQYRAAGFLMEALR